MSTNTPPSAAPYTAAEIEAIQAALLEDGYYPALESAHRRWLSTLSRAGAQPVAWRPELPNAPGAWLVALDDETDMEACWTLLPVFRDEGGLVCESSSPIDGQPCSVTVAEKVRALHGDDDLACLRFAGPLVVGPPPPSRESGMEEAGLRAFGLLVCDAVTNDAGLGFYATKDRERLVAAALRALKGA